MSQGFADMIVAIADAMFLHGDPQTTQEVDDVVIADEFDVLVVTQLAVVLDLVQSDVMKKHIHGNQAIVGPIE